MTSTAMASRAISSTAARCERRGARATGGRRGARAGKTRAGASELAAVDAVIDLLLEAKDEEELAKTVAENVLAFDQQMWMRFASRSDGVETAEEKTRLMEAAGKCMKLVEAMVERTESTIEEASSGVQQVVGAAADPASGEFDVPLKADALERMKSALETVAVDERMLNTIYAWIRKSDENGLDGMVHILQRLLQLYAARELDEKKTPLDTVIRATAEEWTMHFIDVSKDGYSETAFVKDLQRRMEGVVLNLPNGSYAQRVQAEYLKEIEDRGKEFFASQQA